MKKLVYILVMLNFTRLGYALNIGDLTITGSIYNLSITSPTIYGYANYLSSINATNVHSSSFTFDDGTYISSSPFKYISGGGWVGTATSDLNMGVYKTIVSSFTQTGGSFLSSGTIGSIPTTGSGTRMMWYPKKAAFRAGKADSTEWDDASIGTGSVGFGIGTTVSGTYALGFGDNCTVTGYDAFGCGYYAHVDGAYSFATGVVGIANGNTSVAMGRYANALGDYSFALGNGVTAGTADNTFTIGKGVSDASWLVNNKKNSLIVGFQSTTPTFEVVNGTVAVYGELKVSTRTTSTIYLGMAGSDVTLPISGYNEGVMMYQVSDHKLYIATATVTNSGCWVALH